MIEVVDGFIRTQGKSYKKGETLKLGADEEKRLVTLGVAKFVDEKGKGNTGPNKNADPGKKTDSNQQGTDEQKQDNGEGPNTQLPLE